MKIISFEKDGITYLPCKYCPDSSEKFVSTTKHELKRGGNLVSNIKKYLAFNGIKWALEHGYTPTYLSNNNMEFATKTRYFIQVKSGAKVYFETLEKAEQGFNNMPKNIAEWILGKEIIITQDLKAGKHTDSRTENIVCPECGLTQKAVVLHTAPFHTYLHDCIRCGYTIMESEWVIAK